MALDPVLDEVVSFEQGALSPDGRQAVLLELQAMRVSVWDLPGPSTKE